jgi:phage tail sheath protein FI
VGTIAGSDGQVPLIGDYRTAFSRIEQEVDLFNLMVLPRADDGTSRQTDGDRGQIWGEASAFCATQRAFLLVDPPSDAVSGWATIDAVVSGANTLRIGVETRSSAVFYPRLLLSDGRSLDPAGAIAGLMARTDANRGVWKAPAGLEATLRGVSGVTRRMSDAENGLINPLAVNALRVFPAGIVSWGARTLVGFDGSGNIDDKYIPVRRTMLFIEESLYRGLQFAVFEPNDEPLWAQIRLAAGSFMNGLFRQGAFAGQKASDAYFVQCDAITTTPNDINLGIVNVIVGFAPLKPAEFVVVTIQQIAGQSAV